MQSDIHLSSIEDMRSWSEHLGEAVREVIATRGCVVHLEGELGAGKTALVRAMVPAFGVEPTLVTSPTFVLEHEYEGSVGVVIRHWDLYRLRGAPPELLEPPLRGELRLIEWASRAPELPPCDLLITLRFAASPETEHRVMSLSGPLSATVSARLRVSIEGTR